MSNKPVSIILFIIAMTLATILFAFGNAYSSGSVESPRTPTRPELEAFQNLAGVTASPTAWPIYKISNSQIELDGILKEEAWKKSVIIYTSGEWFWNERAKTLPWLYADYKDLIAAWRLVYDDYNLYISCQIFDDRHSEGSGSDPWNKVDAVEFNFKVPAFESGPLAPYSEKGIKIWRRFSETTGLIGMIDTVRIPGSITSTGWKTTEPEGSARLGGIASKAHPIEDENVRRTYPGAWAIEFKIPVSTKDTVVSLAGRTVKLNLKVFDQDSSVISENNYFVANMGRSASPWWGSYKTLGEVALFPTFIFTGERNGLGMASAAVPDEFNLYCGKTAPFYDSLTKYVTPGTAIDRLPQQNNGFGVPSVSPNPFHTSGTVEFVLGSEAETWIGLYSASGQLVFSVPEKHLSAGRHGIPLSINSGKKVAPGLYFVCLRVNGARTLKPVTILN